MTSPKGPCLAHFLIDEGPETDLKWVTFQDNSGECWTWRNRDIRSQKNITEGRHNISPFYKPEDVAFKKSDYFLHLRCPECQIMEFVRLNESKNWKCSYCEE